MNFDVLVPISLFVCIAYSIKAVVDARVRKQLVSGNGSPELVRGLLEGDEANRRLSSLRWGITLVALGIGFGVITALGLDDIRPSTLAILLVALGLGNLAFYGISRKPR
ncbi:hypothetical protein [Luteimonas aquatica]|uniref:hypothetical protein n=1 Tax=Luteimonas aquatica TaxID=450364 RepID=UPI001F57F485|nr:hypothetical protein [Luteimonas aquatica]